ncbi:MAG: class I SAM-dependent methyltransferase [Gammaproteobacteria bacterium]|nr:class I SAM-dependent methyltransferase [Gammaproteobacteria bacterium]
MAPATTAIFATLPPRERWFVRARLATAPLAELAARAVGHELLEVGCGHGALLALLAAARPQRQVTGIDLDSRKLAWAERSVGRLGNVRVHAATIEAFAAQHPAAFDTVFVADVLYLIEPGVWHGFLSAIHRALRPGGRLVLKEAEDDGSWRARKTLWQERLMVHLLRRTRSSGAVAFVPRATLVAAVADAGFTVDETVSLARGYTTPHVLLTATADTAPAARA